MMFILFFLLFVYIFWLIGVFIADLIFPTVKKEKQPSITIINNIEHRHLHITNNELKELTNKK
jgi:hypothetical protein